MRNVQIQNVKVSEASNKCKPKEENKGPLELVHIKSK